MTADTIQCDPGQESQRESEEPREGDKRGDDQGKKSCMSGRRTILGVILAATLTSFYSSVSNNLFIT